MTAATAVLAPTMSEATLERQVRQIAKDLGLMLYHTHNSRRSPSGWPDLVIAGPGGVIFRELKRQAEKPTPAQQAWLDVLAAAGLDSGVWRPSDLLNQTVAHEMFPLSRVSGLRVAPPGGAA